MKQTILVVDDNKKIADVLGSYLEEDGFEVLIAYDGQRAFELSQDHTIDLALLDIMVPSLSGTDLAKTFVDSGTPVIFVTAKVTEQDRLSGFKMGADDYVLKPFSPREVVARVRAVLKRSRKGDPAIGVQTLHVGDLLMDRKTRLAYWDTTEVNLTRSEFEILWHMLERPGQVYTRSQLNDITGSLTYENYERNIDAHIKNIRKKLARAGADAQYIKTVVGVGYCLDVRHFPGADKDS